MNPARLLVLLVSLPLLLGGCGEKSIADVKTVKKKKHDVIDEKLKNLSSEEINQLKKAIKILEGHDVTLEQIVTDWLERNNEKDLKEIVVDSTKIVKRKGVAYLVNSEKPFSGKAQTFDDGALSDEVTYQDGKFILEEVYYSNGQKSYIIELDGDGKRVESNSWFSNGQKRRETITDGAKKTIIGWHENGQKKSESNFFNNKLNGLSITWNEDGEELSKVDYTNDVGLETALYENGIKKYELTYNQWKKQKLLAWWPNGQKASEVYFKDDKRNGLEINWFSSGLKQMNANWENGKLRKMVYWNEEGQISSEELYKDYIDFRGKTTEFTIRRSITLYKNGKKLYQVIYLDDDGKRVGPEKRYWNIEGLEKVKVLSIADLDSMPTLLNTPSTRYPSALLKRGIRNGNVVLEVTISTSGQVAVSDVVSSTHPELTKMATSFASRARFSVPRKNGLPVKVNYRWPMTLQSPK